MKRKIISGIMTGVLMCGILNYFPKENKTFVFAEENEKIIYTNTINYECCDWHLCIKNTGEVILSRCTSEMRKEESKMTPIIKSNRTLVFDEAPTNGFHHLKFNSFYEYNWYIISFECPNIYRDYGINDLTICKFHIPKEYFDETVTLYFFDEEININITEENLEKEIIKGDINNDGKIDSSDASYILKYYALASTGQTPTWSEILNN